MDEDPVFIETARRSGLTVDVLRAVLEAGYSLHFNLNKPTMFVRDGHLIDREVYPHVINPG